MKFRPNIRTRPRASSATSRHLPVSVQLHILSLLPPNERALSGRLVSRDAWNAFNEPQHSTASLSQPLPGHAATWALTALQQHARQLPCQYKAQLMDTAAASGCEVNLEVAWELMQQIKFPLFRRFDGEPQYRGSPGTAAVRAGHPHVLGWLIRHCPELLAPSNLLAVAAASCNRAGLQATWEALRLGCGPRTCTRPALDHWVLDSAARSSTPDALARVQWVLTTGAGSCLLSEGIAVSAACSGDLARLQWLQDQGCPVCSGRVLRSALGCADLAVAQWLVDEAGCSLPGTGAANHRRWGRLLTAAAGSADGVAKWRWLRERGAPALDSSPELLHLVVHAAVCAGQVEAVRYLLSTLGPEKVLWMHTDTVAREAIESGSIPLVDCLSQARCPLRPSAYEAAARSGSIAMIRWLKDVAGLSAAGQQHLMLILVQAWPKWKPAHDRGLLEAVQLVVHAGCQHWDAGAVVAAAARRGNLPLVQHLLQQQPAHRPDAKTLIAAVESGCEGLLQWLVGQYPGCVSDPWDGTSPYMHPAYCGDRAMLEALRQSGVPWGARDVVAQAVRQECRAPLLRWLVEQGAPVGSDDQLESAAICAVVRWGQSAEEAVLLRGLVAARKG